MEPEDTNEVMVDRPAPDVSARPVSPARRVDLPARLDMNVAEEIGEALEHLRDTPLIVDASAVEQISTLCVQVLLGARRQWDRDDQLLRLENPSSTFRDALRVLGVEDDLIRDEGIS